MMGRHAGKGIRIVTLGLVLGLGATVPTWTAPGADPRVRQAAQPVALPTRLDDADFWKLVSDISEPGGVFRIADNFTSNEGEIGRVFTMLRERNVRGGVYLGVGPEQNFTYIAAIRPAMAFILDIRRQAVMQHLMFKAVFEMASDRADFISLLFAKPRPAGIEATTSIQQIWNAFMSVPADSAAGARNYGRIVERLTKTHRFTFTADESAQLESVFQAFVNYGPSISTRGQSGGAGGNTLTFADLTGWATDAAGQPQSFLASEDDYRYVKSLHEKNLVVPVSGDFGGPKALRAIGAYLKAQGGTVSAFYLSNVEQYLFQDVKQRAFYENVATLPLAESSVFIRPYSLRRGTGGGQSLCGMPGFLRAFTAGRVFSNNDALACVQ
jgi:hypothetical protein